MIFLWAGCHLDDLIRQAVKKYARLFIQKKVTLDFQPTGKRVLAESEKWLVFVFGTAPFPMQ